MPTAAIIGLGAATIGGALIGKSSTDKATRAQVDAGDKASQQLAASTAQARNDLFKLFPAAQQNTQQGYQGAIDVFKQALPQQAGVLQAGNVAAQNQLLAGMPQYQNAILGAPVDYSQFQTTQLEQPSFDFANQQLQYTDPYALPESFVAPKRMRPPTHALKNAQSVPDLRNSQYAPQQPRAAPGMSSLRQQAAPSAPPSAPPTVRPGWLD